MDALSTMELDGAVGGAKRVGWVMGNRSPTPVLGAQQGGCKYIESESFALKWFVLSYLDFASINES